MKCFIKKSLSTREVQILLNKVGESGEETVESCNRFLQALILRQPEKLHELIYKLMEAKQKEAEAISPNMEEVFRSWWTRHIQWPTHRTRPEDCVLGLNLWLSGTCIRLATKLLADKRPVDVPHKPDESGPKIGDNHEMDFVGQTEESYKAINALGQHLKAEGWILSLPEETITFDVARDKGESRSDFVTRYLELSDQQLHILLEEIDLIIGGVKPGIQVTDDLSNPEDFLVRRMFGEKINGLALDIGTDPCHREQIELTTKSAAIHFGLLKKKDLWESIKERFQNFLVNNLGSS